MSFAFFITVAVLIIGCAAVVFGGFLLMTFFDRMLNPYPHQLEQRRKIREHNEERRHRKKE